MIKKRMNAGYEIVRSRMYDMETNIDGTIVMTAEIVLGHDITGKKIQPWVVWHCFNETDYTWGHYFNNEDHAKMCWYEILANEYRYLEERNYKKTLRLKSELEREAVK